MVLPENSIMLISFAALGIISSMLGVLICVCYLKNKNLREPPGTLNLFQCLPQTLIDLHWGISVFQYEFNMCGGLILFLMFAAWNYNSCLGIEIFLRIRNPMTGGFEKRKYVYYTFPIIISSVFVSIAMWSGATGYSYDIDSCFIVQGHWFKYIFGSLLYFNIPMALIVVVMCWYKMFKNDNQGMHDFLGAYSLILLVYTIFWIPFTIYIVFEGMLITTPGVMAISVSMAASSGLAINITRLRDPNISKIFSQSFSIVIDPLLNPLVRLADWIFPDSADSRNVSSDLTVNLLNKERHDSYFINVFSTYQHQSLFSILMSIKSTYEDYPEVCTINNNRHVHPKLYRQIAEWRYDLNDFSTMIPEELKSSYSKCDCVVSEFAPKIFQHIRTMDRITEEEIAKSLDPLTNLKNMGKFGNDGGRSNAIFYFSYDMKFIVKSVSDDELTLFCKELLPDIHIYFMSNPASHIAKIYGAFKFTLNGSEINIIIMRNLLHGFTGLKAIFDLKGSQVSRQVLTNLNESFDKLNSSVVYKDVDFLSVKKIISLTYEDESKIKNAIKNDVQFFSKHNIIDYSLILGIFSNENTVSDFNVYKGEGSDRDKIFVFGIIDYLQSFNNMKKLEAKLKGFRYDNQRISVIEPEKYATRFFEFLKRIIK